MTNCIDVAKYILEKLDVLSTNKIHKLVYYSQAWSLVWDEMPLFKDNIEAWLSGAIIPNLYELHQGLWSLNSDDLPQGNSKNLSDLQIQTIEAVLDFYGDKDSHWLIDLNKHETPYRNARKGLLANKRGNRIISIESMFQYYGSLPFAPLPLPSFLQQ